MIWQGKATDAGWCRLAGEASTGAPLRCSGFTLIEMIIVLAVLGLLAGLVVSRGPMRSPTVDVRSAATRVLQGMRAARAQAIAADRPLVFTVQPSQHSFRIGSGAPQIFPAGVAIAIEIAGRPARGIGFLPDGSTSGGTVKLASATRKLSVTVDWLSGRMRIAAPAP